MNFHPPRYSPEPIYSGHICTFTDFSFEEENYSKIFTRLAFYIQNLGKAVSASDRLEKMTEKILSFMPFNLLPIKSH